MHPSDAPPSWLAVPAGDARVWRLWMSVRFATEAAARVVYSALLVDEDLQPDRMLRQLSTRGPVLDAVFGADAAKLLRVGIGSFLEYAQLAARAVEAFGDADVVTRPAAAGSEGADGGAVHCRVARVVGGGGSDGSGDGVEMVTPVLRSDAAGAPLVSDALRTMQTQLNAELTRVVLATGATVDDDDNDQQFGEDLGEPGSSSSSSSETEGIGGDASAHGAAPRAPARRGRKRAAPTGVLQAAFPRAYSLAQLVAMPPHHEQRASAVAQLRVQRLVGHLSAHAPVFERQPQRPYGHATASAAAAPAQRAVIGFVSNADFLHEQYLRQQQRELERL